MVNIINRCLSLSEKLTIGLIADGHHIPPFVLANFLNWIPAGRVFLVTDAIAAAGLPPGEYPLAGRTVIVREGDAPRFDDSGQLAGSAATMPAMAKVLEAIRLSEVRIQDLCYTTPKLILARSGT